MTAGLNLTGSPAPGHHPSADILAEYAAGTQRAGFDLVVAAHLRGCAHCRTDVARLERLGGAFLSDIEPALLADTALDNVMAKLDRPAPPLSGQPIRTLDDLLRTARRRWVAPGVWVARVDTPHAPDDRVYLLGVKPGAATARHSHAGAEFTQVLSGALADDGQMFRAGDFIARDEQHEHRPMVAGDETCVCLFATQGRLVASDLIGRIAFALANV